MIDLLGSITWLAFHARFERSKLGEWGKVDSCSRIKDENGKLALGDDEMSRMWKDCFEEGIYII